MNSTVMRCWIAAWVFSILFGEIVGPLLASHALPILLYPLQMIAYYGAISLIFAFIASKLGKLALAVFFFYGVLAEMFLFHNITGPTDIPGILFFGAFYVFLFGIPIWITKRISKPKRSFSS
ncbi:MAG: hypothetical protein WC350_00250 [Candidatus Micrarchaeia archaeon]|jgi:hypothetical protein